MNPAVSALGLGCMGMSIAYGQPDDVESTATVQRAVDAGVNLFATSDAYGNGANETLLGQALRGRRHGVLIATKFGNLALAWLLAQGPDVVPIPGTKRRRTLAENLAATAVVLDAGELATLEAAFPPGVTQGTRYPSKQMASLGI